MAYVQGFGATGDGQTDDTHALQHAIDAGDGAIELPRGTFRITKSLVIDLTKTGHIAFRGSGGTTRLLMDGPGPAVKLIGNHRGTASPPSVQPHTWERERFPTVAGIEILGKHPEADGIELIRTMQATVSEVLIRNCRDGIRLTERNRNFVLSDSHIYDNARYGVFFDRCNLHQIILHGNHISYNKRAGIKSLDGDVHNLQITGNDIEYNNRPGIDTSDEGGAEIDFEAPQGVISEVTIASNTIQATIQPGGANVRIRGNQEHPPYGARLVAITGNVLGSQTRGIDAEHVQRLTVAGNTIYSSQEYAIRLVESSGFAINGNTIAWRYVEQNPPANRIVFENCQSGVVNGMVCENMGHGTAAERGAIELTRCQDIAISETQLLDPGATGIVLDDCVRCRVSANSIVDRRSGMPVRLGIRVRGGTGNLIQNNLLGGGFGRSLEIPAASGLLQNNVLM